MRNPVAFGKPFVIIVVPAAVLASVVGIPATDQAPGTPGIALDGGWGVPQYSANGLCAFGLDLDTPPGGLLGQLAPLGGKLYTSNQDWKAKAGWVDQTG